MRIPLILNGPGVPEGKKNDSLVYLLDVAATVCECAGVPAPPSMEAQSLMPLARSGKRGARDSLMFAYRNVQRALRTDRWKLIVYSVSGKQTTQLFDLRTDPWETKNLADDSAHAERVKELRQSLKTWMKRVDDPVDLDKTDWRT